ncbi:DMT family transporter [Acetobacterium wieringae]|uniref:DMT family transporter n=1 Tax=Acetobacterium wieringae TaxID=52694 RepID=UPI0026F251E4|nr:DMT family transporter [Acetobacterium wieringae]
MSMGIIAAMAAALAAGLIPVLTKALMLDGLDATTILFYRYATVFIMLGLTFIMKKERIRVTKKQAVELVVFSAVGYGGSTFLLAQAFNYMPMGLATMLYFSYPLFVMVIMALIFKEKPNRIKMIALAIAITGIIFLMNFSLDLVNWGSVLALGSGLAYGVYLVSLQQSSLKTLENRVIIFYLGGICAVFFGIQGCFFSGNAEFLRLPAKGIILTVALGAITIFVLQMVTVAIKRIGSTQTALIIAFEAVVTLILGVVLYGEPWNGNTIVGAGLMLVSVILVSWHTDPDPLSTHH